MSHIVKNSKRLQWIKGFTFLLFGNHRFCFILGLLLHKGEKGMSRWSHRAKVTCPPWTSKSVPLSFIHRNFTVNDKHVSSGRKGRKRRRQPESISQLHLPPEEGLVYPASIVPFGRDICTKKNSIIIMTILWYRTSIRGTFLSCHTCWWDVRLSTWNCTPVLEKPCPTTLTLYLARQDTSSSLLLIVSRDCHPKISLQTIPVGSKAACQWRSTERFEFTEERERWILLGDSRCARAQFYVPKAKKRNCSFEMTSHDTHTSWSDPDGIPSRV